MAVNTAVNSDIWGQTGPMSLEEYTLLTQEEALGSDQADPTAASSSPMPGVEGDGAIADATTADPSLSSQTNSQPETAISGENISTPTTRQALELAIENMHKRPMDPKTYNALFSYNNTLQHANTTQKLLDQKQDILQQQKASNASDAEIQRTQADIAKLEDILAQQEQKLSQAEEDPILQAAAEKASAEIVENRRKNDVDISQENDKIDTTEDCTPEAAHQRKVEQLTVNKENGDAFAKKMFSIYDQLWTGLRQEITILTSAGKVRVDAIGRVKNENGDYVIKIVEFKSSKTARLTKNQKKAFPAIVESGGVIVGIGKDGFEGGTIIPPGTTIEVVRGTEGGNWYVSDRFG